MRKRVKKRMFACVACLCLMFMAFTPLLVHAEPAPPLTKVEITDLTVDDNNEIHAEITIIGTQRQYTCWINNTIAKRNYSEGHDIINPRTKKVTGTVLYFHTGMYYTPENYGKQIFVRYQATNARQPWNTLSTSRIFTVPYGE